MKKLFFALFLSCFSYGWAMQLSSYQHQKFLKFKSYLLRAALFGGPLLVRAIIDQKQQRIQELRTANIGQEEVAIFDQVLADSFIHELYTKQPTIKEQHLYDHVCVLPQWVFSAVLTEKRK